MMHNDEAAFKVMDDIASRYKKSCYIEKYFYAFVNTVFYGMLHI